MKKRKIGGMILLGSVVVAVVMGCGDKGEGDGGGGSSSIPIVESTIDAATIQTVENRAVSNGMCTTTVSDNVIDNRSVSATNSVPSTTMERSYEYDNSYTGVLGGSLDVHTQHENGTTKYTYSMNAFENIMNSKDIKLDGSAEKIDHGKPSDYGPVVSNTTAQTNGAVNAEVKQPSRGLGDAEHYSFELKGFNLVYSTEFMKPNKLTTDIIKLTDTDSNKEYSLSNIKADAYGMVDQVENLTAVYNDADVGTLQVRQERGLITVTKDNSIANIPLLANITGSVDLEATDGTKGTIEVVGSNVKMYIKDANGEKTLVSELDCPVLAKQ